MGATLISKEAGIPDQLDLKVLARMIGARRR
jgi:hypothetical protein